MTGVRFKPNTFLYNGRVACALVPSLLVAAMLGGRFVVGCLTVGTMVAYTMDALQLREGAFATIWLTLLSAAAGTVQNIMVNIDTESFLIALGTSVSMIAVMLIAGVWATLQFKWIQMQHPAVALAFERLLISTALPVSAIAQTIGLAALVDAADAPYYMVFVLAFNYYLLCRPLASSFCVNEGVAVGGGGLGREARVQTAPDAFWSACVLVGLPASFYCAVHLSALFHHWYHLSSVALLLALPLIALCTMPHGLWWLPRSVERVVHPLVLGTALLVALMGFEGRVVFHGFSQYIKLQPPWNFIAVTVALFTFTGLVATHFLGWLGHSLDITVAGSLLLICTTAGALAAGIPFHWLPAPLVAACGLALYYDSRSLREYLAFAVGAFVTAGWFVHHHYWFLDIGLQGLMLHSVVKLVVAAVVPALLIPGLLLARASSSIVGALLAMQSVLVCFLEQALVAGQASEGDPMYPPYLVVATSMLGAAISRRLQIVGAIPDMAAWVACSLYVAKMVLLLVPEHGTMWPVGLVLLAVLPPVMLLKPELGKRRVRLQPWQGVALVCCIVLAVAHARFAIFDMVQYLIDQRPTEGMLLGSLLLVVALGCVPLLTTCYPNNVGAQRLLALILGLGVMMMLLQPPLPIRGGAACPKLPFGFCPRLWDERHVPAHSTDDVMIWGTGLARRDHWPRWLLLAAALAGILGFFINAPKKRALPGHLASAGAVGALVGLYLCLELLPGQEVLQGLMLGCCLLVASFLALLPGAVQLGKTPGLAPVLVLIWAFCGAVMVVMQASLPPPPLPQELHRMYADWGVQVDQERAAAARTAVLGVLAAQALLMAFALKLRVSASLNQVEADGQADGGHMGRDLRMRHQLTQSMDFFCGIVPSSVFNRFGKMLELDGAASMALRRLSQEGLGWVPTTGNLLTVLAFVLALVVSSQFNVQGDPAFIFMLAPVLLLLHQDPLLLPRLGERQRYFPPVLVASAFLLMASGSEIIAQVHISKQQAHTRWSGWETMKNVALLLLVLPNHFLFLRFLLDQAAKVSAVTLAMFAPLNLLVALWADPEPLQYLGFAAVLMAVLQIFFTRHVRHAGMKVI